MQIHLSGAGLWLITDGSAVPAKQWSTGFGSKDILTQIHHRNGPIVSTNFTNQPTSLKVLPSKLPPQFIKLLFSTWGLKF